MYSHPTNAVLQLKPFSQLKQGLEFNNNQKIKQNIVINQLQKGNLHLALFFINFIYVSILQFWSPEGQITPFW